MPDLASATLDLHALIAEHYRVDGAKGVLQCLSCGKAVHWVTKHSHDVHGVDVEVQPSLNPIPTPDREWDDVPSREITYTA